MYMCIYICTCMNLHIRIPIYIYIYRDIPMYIDTHKLMHRYTQIRGCITTPVWIPYPQTGLSFFTPYRFTGYQGLSLMTSMGHRPGSWWLARSYNPSAIYNCDSKRSTGLKNRWTTPQLASWHGYRMAHVLRKAPLSNKSYRFCYRFVIVLDTQLASNFGGFM